MAASRCTSSLRNCSSTLERSMTYCSPLPTALLRIVRLTTKIIRNILVFIRKSLIVGSDEHLPLHPRVTEQRIAGEIRRIRVRLQRVEGLQYPLQQAVGLCHGGFQNVDGVRLRGQSV